MAAVTVCRVSPYPSELSLCVCRVSPYPSELSLCVCCVSPYPSELSLSVCVASLLIPVNFPCVCVAFLLIPVNCPSVCVASLLIPVNCPCVCGVSPYPSELSLCVSRLSLSQWTFTVCVCRVSPYPSELSLCVWRLSLSQWTFPVWGVQTLLSKFWIRLFPGHHSGDLQIGTLVAALPGAWQHRASARTGWPIVSLLCVGEMATLFCNFSLSVAAPCNFLGRSIPEILKHVAWVLSNH